MSYDDSDDLAYNPFAEEDNFASGSNLTQTHYSSALLPKLERESAQGTNGRKKHTRSVTAINIVPHSAGLHPLKSALAAPNTAIFRDLGVTRPHLSRIVNEGTLVDAPTIGSDEVLNPAVPPDEERDVIMHEVTSKDSLAGVSLKYGISLPNLRRANQLWTSDSIHLRKVLYIPVDQASRAREFITEPKLISFTPDLQDEIVEYFDAESAISSPTSGESIHASPTNLAILIHKVPTKQLSFFPPPNKISTSNSNGHPEANGAQMHPTTLQQKGSPGLQRYTSSPANNSLTSILTALPIAASTRDEIITRLSFDSVSSSFSDRSRANSDEESGHELDEVAKHMRFHKHKNLGRFEDVDETTMPTPKASQRPSQLPHRQPLEVTSSSSLPKTSHVRSLSSSSPPRFYVSQAHETSIRTYQMEPSPGMQLPTFRSNTVGRSSGKK
ncbi:hypothetical protein B0H34DRAFT_672838 [Crassisporium funariophilum]|nr:hypothetical protein B0H34DRAFT_672838 [Crassisporium funariophilum]